MVGVWPVMMCSWRRERTKASKNNFLVAVPNRRTWSRFPLETGPGESLGSKEENMRGRAVSTLKFHEQIERQLHQLIGLRKNVLGNL